MPEVAYIFCLRGLSPRLSAASRFWRPLEDERSRTGGDGPGPGLWRMLVAATGRAGVGMGRGGPSARASVAPVPGCEGCQAAVAEVVEVQLVVSTWWRARRQCL